MKKLNIEATERLEKVRKALTCLAFAERLRDDEKEREKMLEAEYDEIVAKYDIVDGYIPTQTIFKDFSQEQVELSKPCATREEARKYIEGLNYTDIKHIMYCYEKEEA